MAEHNNNDGRKEVGKVGIIAGVVVVVLVAVIAVLVWQLQKQGESNEPSQTLAGEIGSGKIGATESDASESEPSDSAEAARNVYGRDLFISMETGDWDFPSAMEASGNATVANSELNQCDFYFDVVVDSTQEVVYRSQVLKPGDVLSGIILGEELESGTYPCTLTYHLINSDTGVEYEDSVVLGISITIQ